MKLRASLASLALVGALFLLTPGPAVANHGGSCANGQVIVHLTNNDDTWSAPSPNTKAYCVDALIGDDTLFAGDNSDYLAGSSGVDLIYAKLGLDTIDGGGGNDLLHGGSGCDIIDGGVGDDILYDDNNPSGCGDVIHGGGGTDHLRHCADGNQSNDAIFSDVEFVLTDPIYCNTG